MRKTLTGIRRNLLREPLERQGRHPDPGTEASVARPPKPGWERGLGESAAMKAFEASLRTPRHQEVRAAVLEELSTYWQRDPDETLERCLNWEDYSVAEWQQEDRSTPEGLDNFYQRCESWAYDLLWYDYLRTCGFGVSMVVAIADWLSTHSEPGRHLDFGSGTGTTSLMFHQLGWKSTMGDVSMPLLDFARWRAAQRELPIDSLDVREPLPANAFDVVTAIDTMAHVPDAYESARSLHAAVRPNGYLFANFDVREPTDFNAWHLYSQDHTLHWDIRRAGFRYVTSIAGGHMHVFRRADPTSGSQRVRLSLDAFRYGPPSHVYWRGRRAARRRARRLAQRARRKRRTGLVTTRSTRC